MKNFSSLTTRILKYNRSVLSPSSRLLSNHSWNPVSLLECISDPKRANDVAIRDTTTKTPITMTYKQLDDISTKLANHLSKTYPILSTKYSSSSSSFSKGTALFNETTQSIGCFNKPGSLFAISMLATWKLGKIFVPLSVNQSHKELEYVLEDSKTKLVLYSDDSTLSQEVLSSLSVDKLDITNLPSSSLLSTSSSSTNSLLTVTKPEDPSLVLYTSGTTGKPKGVLHTHSSVDIMVNNLLSGWRITSEDKILHFLPLYHMHGLVNKFLTLLKVGGEIEFVSSAKPSLLFSRFLEEFHSFYEIDPKTSKINSKASIHKKISLLMGVPTVYSNILEAVIEKKLQYSSDDDEKIKFILQSLRLHVCGSAALPDILMNSWHKFSNKILLERYGMTEIGMALSNPYDEIEVKPSFSIGSEAQNSEKYPELSFKRDDEGKSFYETRYEASLKETRPSGYEFSIEAGNQLPGTVNINRRRGYVGLPLPEVECKIVDDDGFVVKGPGASGELYIRGPNVFAEYINKPEATKESFEADAGSKYAWFKTGDVAERDIDGYYKILGRKSADIIKSAGYKLSALEIERELLSHPQISETAVVGVPDDKLGEKIITYIVLRSNPSEDPSFNPQYSLDFSYEAQKLGGSTSDALEFSTENSSKLRKFLGESLSYYKVPRNFYYVSAIPRNNIGKVNKKGLANHFTLHSN